MTQYRDILPHIDPSTLDYQDWLSVGMAIRHEGGTVDEWERWSAGDPERYKTGECQRKWNGFGGSSTPVTAGSLVAFAQRSGWRPERSHQSTGPGRELDWDDVIGGADKDYRLVDTAWVQGTDIVAPELTTWDPIADTIRYLSTLFAADDYVGYVVDAWYREDDSRWLPKAGTYHRTAGDIISELSRYRDIGKAMGDYKQEAGAWIRMNPLDGKGVKAVNVVAFRYALVESDVVSIEKQAAIYSELELPIAALVHSGGKSLHAVVRVDATTKEEYRDRVNFLHLVCNKNGLEIDKQNKDSCRLSRLPGIVRNGHPQFLVAVNQGKHSWEEWKEWVEETNDNLPDFEALDTVWNDMPELAKPLIDGLLRQGHKMLLSGPSKAGKSYLLLELAIAIAEGLKWIQWQCATGRVLYVNLELDRPSCLRRLRDLYTAMGIEPRGLANIDIWNLRGKAVPMDVLAPKMIRRAQKQKYVAIIIDPIYKVITGDENAADKMAYFSNQFDRVAAELGAAVIYCHHHSKGAQGQKSSRDRSSGSGVFSRDPDAILDLIGLNLGESHKAVIENRFICPALARFMDGAVPEWRGSIGQDTAIVASHFYEAAKQLLPEHRALTDAYMEAKRVAANVSGWRLEGTLREFPPFPPQRVLFAYPTHQPDDGILESAKAEGEEAPWTAAQRERKATKGSKTQTDREALLAAHSSLESFDDGPVLIGDLAESMGKTVRSLKMLIGKTRELVVGDDNVVRTKAQAAAFEVDHAIDAVRDMLGVVKMADLATAMGVTEQGARKKLARDGRYKSAGGIVVDA